MAFHVRIGRIVIGHTGEVLQTVLGSCVAIVMICRDKNLVGMAHCLLPDSKIGNGQMTEARFVDHAVPNLIQRLNLSPIEIPKVEVWVAGGGNVIEVGNEHKKFLVGKLNIEAAQTELKKHGFKIRNLFPASNHGTKVTVDCTQMLVSVEAVDTAA